MNRSFSACRSIVRATCFARARGTAAKAYENGVAQRTVLVEFPSVAAAVACHDGAAYQEALRALGEGSVERDLRVVEGVD